MQVLRKVGWFSLGLLMLPITARLVRAHMDFCTTCGQTQWFLLFRRRDLCFLHTVLWKVLFLHWTERNPKRTFHQNESCQIKI